MIRILLAEDQAMVRGALTALLSLETDIEVLGAAPDGITGLLSQFWGWAVQKLVVMYIELQISAMQFGWHWEDNPEIPVKFRVFVQQLPIRIESEGTYTLGLYRDLDGREVEQTFPLQVGLSPNVRQ